MLFRFPHRLVVRRLVAWTCLVWGTMAFYCCGVGFGQSALPAALARPRELTPERRAELYEQLRRRAEVLEAQSDVVKLVAKLASPTVVYIEADTVQQHPNTTLGRTRRIEEAGSGVIVSWKEKHYVLTNRHVIHDATPEKIKISLSDGRRLTPNRVWEDLETDIAVMAITADNLCDAPLGNSDAVETGDFVLAVGSPFGLSHSVTFGIVSAKGRRDLDLADSGVRFQDFLQTDAAINPGNSGGPLIDLHGRVIGINTAIASVSGRNEGIGFAIPINMFMRVSTQLIEQGTVTRAFMGVNLDSRFTTSKALKLGLPRCVGALVTGVTPDSPAAAAHLQANDVILEYEGTVVEDDSHLVNLVAMTEVGKGVKLLVFRGGQTVSVSLLVGDRDQFGTSTPAPVQNNRR